MTDANSRRYQNGDAHGWAKERRGPIRVKGEYNMLAKIILLNCHNKKELTFVTLT